jgi:hypothetical protein
VTNSFKTKIKELGKANGMAPRYAVSDSDDDSDSSQLAAPSKPSDDALEKALRDAVAKIYQSGKMEELTVKRVRLAAERVLEIEEGFFKGDSAWKSKSDQVIKDEAVCHCYPV